MEFDTTKVPVSTEHESIDFDVMDEIQALIASIGDTAGRAQAKIYRADGGKYSWLFNALPKDAYKIEEILRDKYKGGDFEMRIYADGKIASRKSFSIEPPIEEEKESKSGGVEILLVQMMQQMNENFNAGLGKLAEIVAANKPEPVNQFDQFQQTVAMLGTVKGLFGGGSSGKQESLVSQMREFMELQKDMQGLIGGGADQPDLTPGQMLMQNFDKILGVVSAALPAGMTSAPQEMATLPPPQNNEGDTMNAAMKPAITQLVHAAGMGADVKMVAPEVWKKVPAILKGKFRAFIMQPDAVSQMASLVPDVAPHAQWFHQLRQEIINMLTAQKSTASIGKTIQSGTINAPAYNKPLNGNP